LIACFQMWHTGTHAAEQCEGCTFSTTHINELSYLNSRDVSYATFCQGVQGELAVSRLHGLDGSLVRVGRPVLRTPVPVGAAGWPTSQDN
jgi:hypothetical protein